MADALDLDRVEGALAEHALSFHRESRWEATILRPLPYEGIALPTELHRDVRSLGLQLFSGRGDSAPISIPTLPEGVEMPLQMFPMSASLGNPRTAALLTRLTGRSWAKRTTGLEPATSSLED